MNSAVIFVVGLVVAVLVGLYWYMIFRAARNDARGSKNWEDI